MRWPSAFHKCRILCAEIWLAGFWAAVNVGEKSTTPNTNICFPKKDLRVPSETCLGIRFRTTSRVIATYQKPSSIAIRDITRRGE